MKKIEYIPELVDPVTVPSSPSAGHVKTYVRGRVPYWLDNNGTETPYFTNLFIDKKVYFISPGTGTALLSFGQTVTNVATVSHPNRAIINSLARLTRWRNQTAVAAGSSTGNRVAFPLARVFFGGQGGFKYQSAFGFATINATYRFFNGLLAQTTAIANVQPSALLNSIGIGADTTDTQLNIIHNDGFGVATKIPLGINFPKTINIGFKFEIESSLIAPLVYKVTNLQTNAVATGSIATNFPNFSTLLTMHNWCNTGTTAIAVNIECAHLYLETGVLL